MVWEIFSMEIFVLVIVVGICDILVVILDRVIKFVNLSDGIFMRDFVDRKFFYDRIVGFGNSVVFVSFMVVYIRVYDFNMKEICLFIKVFGEDLVDVVNNLIFILFYGG